MNLTKEDLLANSALSALTEEQVSSVLELIKNAEEQSIEKKKIAGADKKKKKNTEVDIEEDKDLETKKEDIKESKEMKDMLRQISELRKEYKELRDESKRKEKEYEEGLRKEKLTNSFNETVRDLEFKGIYPKKAQAFFLDSLKREIFSSYSVDHDDSGNMVFRDKEGNVLLNKGNLLKPYSLGELIRERLDEFLDKGDKKVSKKATFVGEEPKSTNIPLDLSHVKDQVEGDRAIQRHLMASGLTNDSQEFHTKLKEIRTEAGIDKLPMVMR